MDLIIRLTAAGLLLLGSVLVLRFVAARDSEPRSAAKVLQHPRSQRQRRPTLKKAA